MIAQPAPQDSVLYRSHIEICRILQFLANDRCPVSAEVGARAPFVSHILSVDAASGHFAVAYCTNKSLNSALFGLPSPEFTATFQEAHLAFRVSAPNDTQLDSQPAIQFDFPESITFFHRRKQPRVAIPEDVSLRCIADEGGVISFEARIADISLGGMGGLFYSADIILEAGTTLKNCRIIVPGGRAIVADLEVRYTKAITLPDGTLINRAGVRFVQRSKEMEELIARFSTDPDDTATTG